MNAADKALRFAGLHVKGNPLILYNIWDAASAKAVEKAGARALATGSWSLAAAHGYADGQAIPFDFHMQIVERIAAASGLPVSVDFEAGYAEDLQGLVRNVERLIAAGAIGMNFEDQVIGGGGLRDRNDQADRIAAIREAADSLDLSLFVNARTDIFLQAGDPSEHVTLMGEAMKRAETYRAAGANGFFVPGLADEALISDICAATDLPVNIMMMPGVPDLARLKALGVSRVSYGGGPQISLMRKLGESAGRIFSQL